MLTFLLLSACRLDPSNIVNLPPEWVRTSDQPVWDCEDLDPELPSDPTLVRWYDRAIGFAFDEVDVGAWQGCLTYTPGEGDEPGVAAIELQAFESRNSRRTARVSILLDDVIDEHLDGGGDLLRVTLNGVEQFEAGGSGLLEE